MTAIATKRSKMTQGARELLNTLDNILQDILEVSTESLPEKFKDNRSDVTSFKYIAKKIAPKKREVDNRSISCKFAKKELTEATDERLTAIIAMEGQASNKEELCYHPNEIELYKRQVEFVCKLVEWGCLSKADFDIKD